MTDLGPRHGGIIDTIIFAAIALAAGKKRMALQRLKQAHRDLGILISEAEQQYSTGQEKTYQDHPARCRCAPASER